MTPRPLPHPPTASDIPAPAQARAGSPPRGTDNHRTLTVLDRREAAVRHHVHDRWDILRIAGTLETTPAIVRGLLAQAHIDVSKPGSTGTPNADPTRVTGHHDLTRWLRHLHIHAGMPTFTALQRSTGIPVETIGRSLSYTGPDIIALDHLLTLLGELTPHTGTRSGLTLWSKAYLPRPGALAAPHTLPPARLCSAYAEPSGLAAVTEQIAQFYAHAGHPTLTALARDCRLPITTIAAVLRPIRGRQPLPNDLHTVLTRLGTPDTAARTASAWNQADPLPDGHPHTVHTVCELTQALEYLRTKAGGPSNSRIGRAVQIGHQTIAKTFRPGPYGLRHRDTLLALVRHLDPHADPYAWAACWQRVKGHQHALRHADAVIA